MSVPRIFCVMFVNDDVDWENRRNHYLILTRRRINCPFPLQLHNASCHHFWNHVFNFVYFVLVLLSEKGTVQTKHWTILDNYNDFTVNVAQRKISFYGFAVHEERLLYDVPIKQGRWVLVIAPIRITKKAIPQAILTSLRQLSRYSNSEWPL